jgi:ribulose-phosphate 3-epimerase
MSLSNNNTIIIPSILVLDEDTFVHTIELVRDNIDMVQIDLADGEFVENTTWTYEHYKKAIELLDGITFELHMMVNNPIETAENWKDAPGLRRYLLHIESTDDVDRAIDELNNFGKDVVLVINPNTPVDAVRPFLDKIRGVMFMGVHPGFQGQSFIPETIDRIIEFKALGTNHIIEVDGGVNMHNIKEISDAGATIVCPGSAVFGGKESPTESIWRLEEILQGFESPEENEGELLIKQDYEEQE